MSGTYCMLHTIVAIYLFAKRSDAPEYSTICWPLWFLICSILLVIFFTSGLQQHNPFLHTLLLRCRFYILLVSYHNFGVRREDRHEMLFHLHRYRMATRFSLICRRIIYCNMCEGILSIKEPFYDRSFLVV